MNKRIFLSIFMFTLTGCASSPGEIRVTLAQINAEKEISLAIINTNISIQRAKRQSFQNAASKPSTDAQRPEGSGEIPDEYDPGYEPIAQEPEEEVVPRFFKEVPHSESNSQTKVHSIAGGDSVVIQHSPGAQINVGSLPDALALAQAKRLNRRTPRLKTWDDKVKNVSAPVVTALQSFFPWFFGSKVASSIVKEIGDEYNLEKSDFLTSDHNEDSHKPITTTTTISSEGHDE